MKRLRTTTNSLKLSSQHQFIYLPDECWELVFKHLLMDYTKKKKHLLMDDEAYMSLSFVSKQFLSITNRLRFSLTIKYQTTNVLDLIRRFPNLTSLHLCGQCGDLDELLYELSTFSLKLTSLSLSNLRTIPANGLLDFAQNIRTLTSFTCSYTEYLYNTHMFLIADCFPNLQMLDLNRCDDISQRGVRWILCRCHNLTHLNLTGCSDLKLYQMMNFQAPNLEVLNLSYSNVDDQTLISISNSFRGILQLFLKYCADITHSGVNRVLYNCTRFREINLNGVNPKRVLCTVDSMVLLRPSLRKITLPSGVCWVQQLN